MTRIARLPQIRTAPLLLLVLALCAGIFAMHQLPMEQFGTSMPDGMYAHAITAAPQRSALDGAQAMPMAGCDTHLCVAARGATKVAPLTLPPVVAVAAGVGVDMGADAEQSPACSGPRAPPRSDLQSVLCVWRV